MKRIIIATGLIFVMILSGTTLVFAKVNDTTLKETLVSILRYDFKSVKEIPDNTNRDEAVVTNDKTMVFKPVNLSDSWLSALANGGNLSVVKGSLEFDNGKLTEQYIDIKGEKGQIRLLHNSSSATESFSKTLYWSFKQQDGSSIVKGTDNEVNCVVLFESADGRRYIYGYQEGDGTDFWSLNLPQKNYYSFQP